MAARELRFYNWFHSLMKMFLIILFACAHVSTDDNIETFLLIIAWLRARRLTGNYFNNKKQMCLGVYYSQPKQKCRYLEWQRSCLSRND